MVMFGLRIIIVIVMLLCSCFQNDRADEDQKQNNNLTALAEKRRVVFELERIFDQCYGRCPVYTLTIYSDGEVVFEGKKNVKKFGTQVSKISDGDIRLLKNKFDSSDFMNLSDRYVVEENCSSPVLSDGDSARIYYHDGKTSKSIMHYSGCYGYGVFETLRILEKSIDSTTNSNQWIK